MIDDGYIGIGEEGQKFVAGVAAARGLKAFKVLTSIRACEIARVIVAQHYLSDQTLFAPSGQLANRTHAFGYSLWIARSPYSKI